MGCHALPWVPVCSAEPRAALARPGAQGTEERCVLGPGTALGGQSWGVSPGVAGLPWFQLGPGLPFAAQLVRDVGFCVSL